jgi:hypothetical protein
LLDFDGQEIVFFENKFRLRVRHDNFFNGANDFGEETRFLLFGREIKDFH